MSIFRNVVFIAAVAGFLAGLAMTVMQVYFTAPLILKAEACQHAASQSARDHTITPADASGPESVAFASSGEFGRFPSNVITNILSSIGFALILTVVSEMSGGACGWRAGVLWGIAGFVVFTLAPGLGLPPELPAMPAADLWERQLWWMATVAATAAGLALIAFRGSVMLSVLGVALIVMPHAVGAPQPETYTTPIPTELHHRFVVAVMMTSLVFWALLGGLVGLARPRLLGEEKLSGQPA